MFLGLIAVFAVIGPVLAQVTPPRLPSQAEPGRPPDRIPFDFTPAPDLELSIPAPQRTPSHRAVDDIEFEVSQIIVEGMTVYAPDAVQSLINPVLNHAITIHDLTLVADAIEAKYRDAGFVLTRCFVPAQRVGGTSLRIQVVEGFVKNVVIEGGEQAARDAIKALADPLIAERPTRIETLERLLLMTNQLAGVSATGTIRPGIDPGAADLIMTVKETPIDAYALLSNRGSPYSGRWSLYGEVASNDALGEAERITLGSSVSSDLKETRSVTIKYAQPIFVPGLTLGFESSYSNGEPGFTLAAVDARTWAARFGPRISYDWIRTRHETLVIQAALIAASVESDEQGAEISHDDYRLAEIKADYSTTLWFNGVTSVGVTIDQGLPILGASRPNDSVFETRASRFEARPDFTKFYGEVQRLQPLWDNLSAALTVSGQYSLSTLYAAEEYTLGGSRIGRGYDPAEIAGDYGLGGAAELRWDETIDLPYLQSYQLYSFYDTGQVWNRRSDLFGHATSLTSVGAGVHFTFDQNITVSLELAQPLTRLPSDEGGSKLTRGFLDASMRF